MAACGATFAGVWRMKMNPVFLKNWGTRENLNSHLKAERFRVIRGAMNLLREPYEMRVHTITAVKNRTKTRSQPEVQ